jgi:hypothetical protein
MAPVAGRTHSNARQERTAYIRDVDVMLLEEWSTCSCHRMDPSQGASNVSESESETSEMHHTMYADC